MVRMLCCILLVSVIPLPRADAGLRCVPCAIDLGEVRGGPARQHRFELINDGPADIEICDIERGCGCLTPKLDRRTLKPGDKTSLIVVVRTAGQPNGPRSWNLRLRYRDGATIREELLVIAATIHNEVTVQPAILALHVRDVLRQEVIVTDLRMAPLKVTSVQTSSPAIRASVQSATGGVTKLQLEVTGAVLSAGALDAKLTIYTDDPLYSPLELPIALTRITTAQVTVTPSPVELPRVAGQPVAAAIVRLRPADGHKLAVESATADDPGITCTWATGPGTAVTLKVRVDTRGMSDRPGPRCVRVRLTEPAGEVVTIPVWVKSPQ